MYDAVYMVSLKLDELASGWSEIQHVYTLKYTAIFQLGGFAKKSWGKYKKQKTFPFQNISGGSSLNL